MPHPCRVSCDRVGILNFSAGIFFFRPFGACPLSAVYPTLARWAAFLRSFGAAGSFAFTGGFFLLGLRSAAGAAGRANAFAATWAVPLARTCAVGAAVGVAGAVAAGDATVCAARA